LTRIELVLSKAASVRRRLERLTRALSIGLDAFVKDEERVEAAAFNVFLAMQECIDLGSHVVADERWGAPETLADVFTVLQQHGVLTGSTTDAMRRGSRLRNLIAHAYGDIDPAKLFESASAGVGQIGTFLAEVEAWLPKT
jgi:uncharacterized protein YutE (UPF0331/DUF86 family)